ncbi:MAG: hypothetical protein HYT93_02610 [Parcubacteria group bacterium]|nr:hypothetical protein [Parcubacteria group bacterium]
MFTITAQDAIQYCHSVVALGNLQEQDENKVTEFERLHEILSENIMRNNAGRPVLPEQNVLNAEGLLLFETMNAWVARELPNFVKQHKRSLN